ncbi:50S ribosomal protein L6 [Gemella haemolysans]|jgi:ribosomal protein L6|uniref:Large ribosomal subunit protein uL6 n=2 Tax=Gemella haemolysans TaxID=1379 RepID=A0A133ZP82_9BACL|nr:50S ribosomal protein L6 [Gemella haemolysans]RKW29255.1 MAG: 50S ribosomal protein L6 [Granulicatella sp.]TKW63415.1 MAG: 50S ribosomal protein L6 [Gemella sp.]EER68662.1 ribosomal protein L6 [Gemella haemolysans ATCC 10379]KAA8708275.1 50S ribosomal protein L6 [Gemella haemolysans]KXB57245.1 ribosomal protein L6 [Gemella haemolysans]
MSRIGNKVITVPAGVEVNIVDNFATVKGPKGELKQQFDKDMTFNIEGSEITVVRPSDSKRHRTVHGTTRAILANMVEGVSAGFKKELELIGVGYRAQMQGKKLVLSVGYSHPVEFEEIEGITLGVEGNTKVSIEGINKEVVGQYAAKVRAVRPPEPYKGKGIRYVGEYVRRKEGKTGK